MEYESVPSCTCGTCSGVNIYGWKDWRTVEGQVIHERFSPEFLEGERIRLGSMGYAGQMQQRPLPEGGGLFGIKCFERRWTEMPEQIERTVITLDASFKAGTSSDFAVIQVWASAGPDRYLVEQWRKQAGYVDTRDALQSIIARYPYAKILIEDAANGVAIISQLQREIPGVIAVKPDGGKRSRGLSVQGIVESGAIVLPKHAPWISAWLSEVCSFTGNGDAHDDQVDAMVYALRDLQDSGTREKWRAMSKGLSMVAGRRR
jgi:predicted phage terminase large subunit-like protein